MSVSIIIPVLNDNQELSKLLKYIRSWETQPQEIIVVDAKADNQCKQLCIESDATWLAFNKTRGAQQRFGAQHASGDILWFLYADCLPSTTSLAVIERILNESHGGFFKFSFNLPTKNLTHRVLEFFINWRSKHFMAYGDQGLFFDKRTFFVLDGHADQTLFEEVELIKKVKRLGFKQIPLDIHVSPRQWLKDGFWIRTWYNRKIALRYSLGTSSEALKKDYYA